MGADPAGQRPRPGGSGSGRLVPAGGTGGNRVATSATSSSASAAAVFNALISNNDDHPRNHAVVASSTDWRLVPAYDLTPNPQHGREERELALVCGRFGTRATRENLVSASQRFGVAPDDASHLIDGMVEIVRRYWRADVFARGGTEADCTVIAPAFVHAGSEYRAGQ
jgi:serine/threonine-protein kinase HipA